MEESGEKNREILKIKQLSELIDTLRGENGCPWDKEQTPKTMALNLIEEAYELLEAINSGNVENICEELGDVLFQVLFIANLFKEKNNFDIGDVSDFNKEKMIRRHAHVFGNDKAKDVEDVLQRWHKIKMEEKSFRKK